MIFNIIISTSISSNPSFFSFWFAIFSQISRPEPKIAITTTKKLIDVSRDFITFFMHAVLSLLLTFLLPKLNTFYLFCLHNG